MTRQLLIVGLIILFGCAQEAYYGENDIDSLQARLSEIYFSYPVLMLNYSSACRFADSGAEITVKCFDAESSSGVYKTIVTETEVMFCRGKNCTSYEKPQVSLKKSLQIAIVLEGPRYDFPECNSSIYGASNPPKVMKADEVTQYMKVSKERCDRYEGGIKDFCNQCIEFAKGTTKQLIY